MVRSEITVRLRPPVEADVVARMVLGISSEIVRMYGGLAESQPVIGKRQANRWFRALCKHPHAWAIDADDVLVGEARLDTLNPHDRRARLAIGLFRESDLGRGIGHKAVYLVLEQAFGHLGLHRVDLRVLAYNHPAIRCYQSCGFVREGIERDSAFVGDAWHDDWMMAILEQEYRARTPVL